MEWINLHIGLVIRSPAYVGSSPAERGTWLSVMAYACEIESGGRLVGAGLWKDRQWQQACGVTLREVKAATRLLRFDGDDLVVNGYPTKKEKAVQQARKVAHAGAMARWGSNADRHAENMPTGIATGNAEGEGEEEGEEEGQRHAAPRALSTWIRTGTKDRDRTIENQQTLADLIKRFSLERVQAVAERIVFASHEKIWPDDSRLLASLIEESKPKPPPEEVLPDDLNDLPEGHPLKPKPRVRA